MWLWEGSGEFSVRSAYQARFDDGVIHEEDQVFQHVWKLKIPPKAMFFIWRLVVDRLPTCDNLIRRNIILPDPYNDSQTYINLKFS